MCVPGTLTEMHTQMQAAHLFADHAAGNAHKTYTHIHTSPPPSRLATARERQLRQPITSSSKVIADAEQGDDDDARKRRRQEQALDLSAIPKKLSYRPGRHGLASLKDETKEKDSWVSSDTAEGMSAERILKRTVNSDCHKVNEPGHSD
jgi:hypothetical protein